MPAISWVHKLLFARGPASEPVRGGAASGCDTGSIRYEMLLAVQPCSEVHRNRAVDKIRQAATPADLWQLRPEIYLYLAQDLGQCQANMRINALQPLFSGWVPEAPSTAAKHGGDGPNLH